MSAECTFIRIHNGIPVEVKNWDYMGERVANLFTYHKIGEVVHQDHVHFEVRRITAVDWNQAIALRKTDTHMDGEDMFLLDWSAHGDWFIVIAT